VTGQAIPTATSTTENVVTLTLLVFKVNNQLYGLPVTSVVRIIEMVTITPLPGAPEVIEGIINFHGKAVPIIDLCRCFNLLPCSYGLHTPIILVDMINQDHILGLIVDMVEDVLEVSVDDLELMEMAVPAELGAQMAAQAAYLVGMAKVDQRFILVLNVQSLLNPTIQAQLAQALGMKDK
jgi:purine-binding chemotaxis protein CheW